MPLRGAALVAALFASSCSSCDEAPAARIRGAAPAPAPAPEEDRWTRTDVPGLPLAGPATVVGVRASSIEIDNRPLLESWPAAGMANAREADPGDVDGWPRLTRTLRDPQVEDRSIAALTEALVMARRVEAASTGSPTGAGLYHLRVAPDAPFRWLDPVRYSASLAGYGAPRLRFGGDAGDRSVPWPPSPRADAAQIEAALAAYEAGRPIPDVQQVTGRVRIGLMAAGVAIRHEGALLAPGCAEPAPEGTGVTYPPSVSAAQILACAERRDAEPWTVEVQGDLPFGRVAELLVRLGIRERPVRVLTR